MSLSTPAIALRARLSDRIDNDDDTHDGGFTLVELLVVITILGILAAIVVFSVSGVNDKGQTAACKTDTSTLRTAEESYYVYHTAYADVATLKASGFLSNTSTWHSATAVAYQAGPPVVPASYTITEITPATGTNPCGAGGAAVDGTANL